MDPENDSPGQSGTLYIVATPIGNLEDMSPRATAILSRVSVIAAEDTRHSGRLLQYLGVRKPMVALHDHNERDKAGLVLDRLAASQDVALISDAGTPLISDPGYVLVREARARGFRVSPVPGACALVAALSAAGLPTDRFLFEGFLPSRQGARKAALERLSGESATLVFYESPHRIVETVREIERVMGGERELVLARELTKTFETFYAGPVGRVRESLEADPHGSRGEFVVMIHGASAEELTAGSVEVDRVLALLLTELPVKKAAKLAAELTGSSKNELYQRALELKAG
ncbi:16S rRNA (cytidine(1402)-2'-O)-methyltransferase [Marinobacter orientalis]|uniref:Ribosomal RNA small subunit methyltransferase I n=1 Tax=Marinobacter orientalis TaxID=1928859 RepID=A0A7Y0WSP8_9GAMM|nr:16S rRNA (cytidine(1402)-2'-O)-methyltransferase [Marinobacter orientalis]NMT64000.1 16S rRNA (cytidine(1402)-2'-O)-methyltransferase [Marinobacter orientalis]TGX49236.1 16S rRNA (cytidine(1402)-2'-O)-methyltransferase [Marinobacter orientalis]